MPRVLFIASSAAWSGPANSLTHLIRHVDGRIEPVVVVAGTGPLVDRLQALGVRVHTLPHLRKTAFPRLLRLVSRIGPDLVYANNTSSSARTAFLVSRVRRIPFACHVRGMGASRGLYKLWFLGFCEAVVAVSKAAAEGVRPFRRGKPIDVVYNGIDVPPPVPDDVRARKAAELGLESSTGPVIAQVGNFSARKGQDYSVRVVAALKPDFPDVRLLLAGEMDSHPGYVRRVKERVAGGDLEPNVEFLGFTTDVEALLACSDVVLHPALADPHPRAVLEAMAASRPVVGFDVDGVGETITDGVDGRLVPAEDWEAMARATKDLLLSPDRGRALGRAGRERVKESFTAEKTVDGVLAVIDRVLGRPARDPRNDSRDSRRNDEVERV